MKLKALLAAALLLAGSNLYAQGTGTVTGTVIDNATRQPLTGAQVVVTELNRGAITNERGQFLLTNIPIGVRTVRVILIGYGTVQQSVTVTAAATVRADFELREAAVSLDAVIVNAVTGQAERKRELGTNTARISAADIAKAPVMNLADVLNSRAPGVQLQGAAGTVGTSQRIRIRGANSISLSNEPMIFIDGVLMSNSKGGFAVGGQDYSRFNDINYDDIEDIQVLKGPAASALYGTAASNGVLLITTKRGKIGSAKWSGYTELGTNRDIAPYQDNYLSYQVLNSSVAQWTTRGTVSSTFGKVCFNEDAARGICTQDQVLSLNPIKTAGLSPFTDGYKKKYGLSVGGGNEAVNYYISGDVDRNRGVVDFNKESKVNFRTNIGARISDRVSANINAGYTRAKLALNSNDNSVFSPLINAVLATPFVFPDTQKAKSTPGSRTGTGFGYYISDIKNSLTFQTTDRFILGSSASYKPISWLNVNGNAGLDYFTRNDEITVQPNVLPISATYTPGFRNNQRSTNYEYTFNVAGIATANPLPELKSQSTIGTQYQRELFQGTFCRGVGIVQGSSSCAATSSLFQVDEPFSEVRTIGAYGQQQFNWRDRVILAASLRSDNVSSFGGEFANKFGWIKYPGVSLSWVVSDEPFFPKLSFLNNVRLRSAYGKSGQRPNFRDAITLYEPVSASSNNAEVSAVRLSRVGNPLLKPERTTEIEGGFDANLLKDRVTVELTYFNKKSQDALVQRPLAPSYGLTGDAANTGTIWDNLGSIKNWGTELALTTHPINTRNIAVNVRLGASTLNNKIMNLGANVRPIVFNRGAQQHRTGYPTGAFFQQKYEIIADSLTKRQSTPVNGHVLLQRGDVRLVPFDKDSGYIGHVLPTNSQTLSADVTLFSKLTFAVLLDRRAGMYQNNQTEYFRCLTGYNRGQSTEGNCSGAANPNASVDEQARFIAAKFLNTQYGYLEKSNFVKLREVSVTAQLPASVARWADGNSALSPFANALRNSSITVSGRNLHTWTNYTGLDPEINEAGGGANFTQDEFNTQPPLRYYTIRVNLAF